MNRQEIQNIVARAFEIGCEVGSSSWQIDRCVSESEELKIAERTDRLIAEFESATGFSLGCAPNKPFVEFFHCLKENNRPVVFERICELNGEPVVVKKKSRYSRRL